MNDERLYEMRRREVMFKSYINIQLLEIDEKADKNLSFLVDQYLEHRFDLLGSGPLAVKYGMDVPGFAGIKYRSRRGLSERCCLGVAKESRKYKRYLDRNYQCIDWFIDYKSGFRFRPCKYNSPEKCFGVIGKRRGVEIKLPWELGRFYHLPQLAVYAVFHRERAGELIHEFYQEVLDFICHNPYPSTVQWSSAMDISIRAVNLLVACDMFRQTDKDGILDQRFERAFYELIYRHGTYIIGHLENGPLRGNHFLANLAGLIYISSYLKETEETGRWFEFAARELVTEVKRQYYEDGSHFEGSTSYHRLSTEFILLSVAMIYGVSRTSGKNGQENVNFPPDMLERIYGAALFTGHVMKQNGEIVQIGDNDSGRLLKLTPIGEVITEKRAREKYVNLRQIENFGPYFDENILNHSTLLGYAAGLWDAFPIQVQGASLETSFIKSMTGDVKLKGSDRLFLPAPLIQREIPSGLLYKKKKVFRLNEPSIDISQMRRIYYKKFGLMIYRADRFFLSVVVDSKKSTNPNGHMHNDALSIELMTDNLYRTGDPGSFIYTSAYEMRNAFRSTNAHNTIHVQGKEQNMADGIFSLKKRCTASIIKCTDTELMLKAVYADVVHIRKISIFQDRVELNDYCNHPFQVSFQNRIYSNGYGRIIRLGGDSDVV